MSVDTWRRLQFVIVPALVIGWAIVLAMYLRGDNIFTNPLTPAVFVGNAAWQVGRWHFKHQDEPS